MDECTNSPVTIRHGCVSATGAKYSIALVSARPVTWSSSHTATLTATRTTVPFWSSIANRRRATVRPLGAPDARRFAWNCARCSRTHSGQCTPTAAGVWHSGQIVRPHRWQSTKLCRSGCR